MQSVGMIHLLSKGLCYKDAFLQASQYCMRVSGVTAVSARLFLKTSPSFPKVQVTFCPLFAVHVVMFSWWLVSVNSLLMIILSSLCRNPWPSRPLLSPRTLSLAPMVCFHLRGAGIILESQLVVCWGTSIAISRSAPHSLHPLFPR
jgi:hypothetical protein